MDEKDESMRTREAERRSGEKGNKHWGGVLVRLSTRERATADKEEGAREGAQTGCALEDRMVFVAAFARKRTRAALFVRTPCRVDGSTSGKWRRPQGAYVWGVLRVRNI